MDTEKYMREILEWYDEIINDPKNKSALELITLEDGEFPGPPERIRHVRRLEKRINKIRFEAAVKPTGEVKYKKDMTKMQQARVRLSNPKYQRFLPRSRDSRSDS